MQYSASRAQLAKFVCCRLDRSSKGTKIIYHCKSPHTALITTSETNRISHSAFELYADLKIFKQQRQLLRRTKSKTPDLLPRPSTESTRIYYPSPIPHPMPAPYHFQMRGGALHHVIPSSGLGLIPAFISRFIRKSHSAANDTHLIQPKN
jgi:hypothetical protein